MKQTELIRMSITVRGQVQGVGFRPFIWRLATAENLTGSVRNTSAGVRIEIQGPKSSIQSFEQRLDTELPPLARIVSTKKEELPLAEEEVAFEIGGSQGHAGQNVLVSADVGVCDECLAEMRDPDNPRFGYAFINCVNCGPRFTITRSIPYDRPVTTMACFELCKSCSAEYINPADRRFHAQPVACASCGPDLWFAAKGEPSLPCLCPRQEKAMEKAGQLILAGGILALKGLGGFQLVCNARDAHAVATLRSRKKRPHKALAVMSASIADAARFCQLSTEARSVLEGPKKPITLCQKLEKPSFPLAAAIAPDTSSIGIMMPYTPLHALLFDWLAANGLESPCLVMTSANPRDEPICLGNREALSRLGDLADGWLLHNRDILVRVDDSVVDTRPHLPASREKENAAPPFFIRRARGYVPEPCFLPVAPDSPSVLGVGAELKSTFCLSRGSEAFLSQHIGDLKNLAALHFYTQSLEHLERLLETGPRAVVRDLHPDYISSQFAEDLAKRENLPLFALQHHAAHAVAALADENHKEPALALCLDGAGLGDDGTIWGGELLLMHLAAPSWRRLGRISTFPLPGGDMAAAQPWRIARALQWQKKCLSALPGVENADLKIIDEMLDHNLNCPSASSCGRLFDAVAASLGLCQAITYEGQAAIRLEKAAQDWMLAHPGKAPPFSDDLPIIDGQTGLLELDGAELLLESQKALAAGMDPSAIAAAFHHSLAFALARMARHAAGSHNAVKVALCGGVMQNRLMSGLISRFLLDLGLKPVLNREISPGDGGLSLGQALWGIRMMART